MNKKKDQINSQEEVEQPLLYPDEPSRFVPKDLEAFLIWCAKNRTSDLTIQTNEQIIAAIDGKIHRVTRHRMGPSEIMEWVVEMYKSESAKAILAGPSGFLDFSYAVRPDRVSSYRFRINVTAINVGNNVGIQITARTISSIPPDLKTMDLHPEILDNIAPKQGMIIITGATGSGKSTLLASIIRYLLEQEDGHRKILTFEAPIEFVYDEVDKPTSSIAQTEIHRTMPSFGEGTRNALRRKPDIILVGEARDAETIGETVTASMTGHLVYSTVHSNGFAETIRRMVNAFTDDRASRALDIISSLRMVISQRLVPSTDGKRVALREWVIFNEEIVEYLLDAGVENLMASCRYVLKKYGHSFSQDAQEKHSAGLISDKTLFEVNRGLRVKEEEENGLILKNNSGEGGQFLENDEGVNRLADLVLKKLLSVMHNGLVENMDLPVPVPVPVNGLGEKSTNQTNDPQLNFGSEVLDYIPSDLKG